MNLSNIPAPGSALSLRALLYESENTAVTPGSERVLGSGLLPVKLFVWDSESTQEVNQTCGVILGCWTLNAVKTDKMFSFLYEPQSVGFFFLAVWV